MKTVLLYIATAFAEIVGCYLPWLWIRQGGSAWLLVPAVASLALFAWLLTLHDAASGRVYGNRPAKSSCRGETGYGWFETAVYVGGAQAGRQR